MVKPKAIAVLLARGGSKGVSHKNLQMIGGFTLVRNMLETACNSDVFNKIILSSDDPNILFESHGLNVKVHERSYFSSNDRATSEEGLSEVLRDFEISSGLCFLLQCTTPFISAVDFQNMYKLAIENPDSTIVSGYVQSIHHWLYDASTKAIQPISATMLKRQPRQEGKNLFIENGGAYVLPVSGFLSKRSRFMKNIIPYEMTRHASIDIDDAIDLDVARFLFSRGK